MTISYNNLWKLLIEKGMKKKDLQAKTKLTSTTIAKLSKNENVNTSTLIKICDVLDCKIEDIIEIEKGDKK